MEPQNQHQPQEQNQNQPQQPLPPFPAFPPAASDPITGEFAGQFPGQVPGQFPGQIGHAPAAPRTNPLAIVSFALSFVQGFIAVLLGVIALRQNWVRGLRGNGFAWAGIIIGAIGGVLGTMLLGLLGYTFLVGATGT